MKNSVISSAFLALSLMSFANDSIPKPLKWGVKFNYDCIRYVPSYIYAVGDKRELYTDFSLMNFGAGFQFYGKNKFLYHELSLSRLWFSRQSEGYRFEEVRKLDSMNLNRFNENFQIGLRYSFYLQTSSRKVEKRHKFFMEFPLEVLYHFNSAVWSPKTDSFTFRSVGYRTNGIGFTVGVVPHYHCFITNQVYFDLSFPIQYSAIYAFTTSSDSDISFINTRSGSGFFGDFFNLLQYPLRIAIGFKLHEPKKKRAL